MKVELVKSGLWDFQCTDYLKVISDDPDEDGEIIACSSDELTETIKGFLDLEEILPASFIPMR